MKSKIANRKGSASVEVIMSVGVFMALMVTAFWFAAKVYAAIYGINAVSSGAGLSIIVTHY